MQRSGLPAPNIPTRTRDAPWMAPHLPWHAGSPKETVWLSLRSGPSAYLENVIVAAPKDYRHTGQELLILARQARDPELQAIYLRLAAGYDELARFHDRMTPSTDGRGAVLETLA